MNFDDYLNASHEQSELLEELQEIIKNLEEIPGDENIRERVLQILNRLGELRETLRDLSKGEGEDFELLKRFYSLVGVHDEKEILEELLKLILKGKLDIDPKIVTAHIRDNEDFAREFLEES